MNVTINWCRRRDDPAALCPRPGYVTMSDAEGCESYSDGGGVMTRTTMTPPNRGGIILVSYVVSDTTVVPTVEFAVTVVCEPTVRVGHHLCPDTMTQKKDAYSNIVYGITVGSVYAC
eukprot:PhM_4_TR7142/c0_g1_i1/m.38954